MLSKQGRPRVENAPRLIERGRGSGKWFINWQAGGKRYRAALAASREEAGTLRAKVELALKGWGEWPEELARCAAVRAYLRASRGGAAAEGDGDLERYCKGLPVQEPYRRRSLAVLRELEKFCGGDLRRATAVQAREWLAKVAKEKSQATRNRRLTVAGRFFRFASRAWGWGRNPFEGERQQKAARADTAIQYLTRKERGQVLAAADKLPDGLVAWVCLWAGVRRNEAWRLTWGQIDLDAGTLVAQSKRGAARVVPLAPALKKKLAALAPKGERQGALFHFTDKTAQRLLDGLRAALPGLAPLIHYNTFRHTFCTLLAQAGVSIDKIAAWAGHHPQVCRQHYARFSKKAGADEDILKL